jgi:hypothetical protein
MENKKGRPVTTPDSQSIEIFGLPLVFEKGFLT